MKSRYILGRRSTLCIVAILGFGLTTAVHAQYAYTTLESTYAQDFNGLGTSSANPTGGDLGSVNSGLTGWYFVESGTGANTTITAGTGSGTAGDTYNFGLSGNSDRTLGGLQSGSVNPTYGFYLTNGTGSVITSIDIGYTGKTWRVGAANRSDRLDFQYSLNATSLTTGSWTDVDGLDYANPGQAAGSGSIQHSASIAGTITGLNIPSGFKIFIRWNDFNASGADDGMGIDDLSLVAHGNATVNTSVQFATSAGFVTEGASTALTLTITDYSASAATSVTIGYTDPNGRIGSAGSTVTFPANSAADQNVIVTVNDDALCNGDEGVVFTITGISGGQGTPVVGATGSYALQIIDNDELGVPVATTPTTINSNDFTATWNTASAATGYQLDVSAYPTFSTPGPLTTMEGFASGTTAPGGWAFNSIGGTYTSSGNYGASSPSIKFDDTGDRVTSPTLSAAASELSFWIKGQTTNATSALLVEGYNGTTWTTIEDIAPLPTSGTTKSYTGLTPNNYVQFRFTYTKSIGNLAFDDVSYTCLCGTSPSFLPGYENLSVSGTSQSVTGLDASTDYYYRVRAVGGGCPTTDNSNVIQVTTAVGTSPLLTAGTLADFGGTCRNTTAGPVSFTIDGSNLTTSNVTVSALSGFMFSVQETGTYTASISIAQPGGSFTQDVWVKFSPTAAQSYNGNITIAGGGADAVPVAATGSGIETPPSLTTGVASNIGIDQATVAGTIDAEGCFPISAYGIEYSTTENFSPGSGTQVPSTNEVSGSFTSLLNGVSPCSTYWFRVYVTNSEGTAYGDQDSFSTPALAMPVATQATTVGTQSFTATWNPVAGASGYSLDVSSSPTFGLGSASTSEGFDSGYTSLPSGWSQTGITGNYSSDGGVSTPSLKFDNTGDQLTTSAYPGVATQVSFWYKGQGTAGSASQMLVEGFNGSSWEAIGIVGSIPSSGTGTASYPLNAASGFVQFRFTYTKATGNLAFDDVAVQYITGTPSYLPGYDNLPVAGTSQGVTGLDPSTTYYYRVRAASATCEPLNSNTISVTTHAVPVVCTGNKVVVAIHTDANGDQTTWEIRDAGNAVVASGGPYTGQNNTLATDTICLGTTTADACYTFRLFDSFGDGLGNSGGWQLLTTTGKVIIEDSFEDGSVSPATPPASASYGSGHSFCLPLGNCNIAPTECGIYTNLLGNKVFCNKVAGATQYEFEFSDPDGGFIRRITRNINYVHFGDMVSNPLIPGVHYFCRVRTNKFGPIASAHFGSGCDMGLSVSGVVTCTQLISAPAYGHSCNETRPFHSNGYIYAVPVDGATQYQFHIYNTETNYDTSIARNTYILALSWGPRPMVNGITYNVEMNVRVNGLETGFCPSSCTITIDNGGPQLQQHVQPATAVRATLWPNPTNNGRVNLFINGLPQEEQQIKVDIRDLYGRQVYAQDIGNSGDTFNTELELPNDVSSGIYLVNLTVNGEASVHRLSVIR